MTDAPNTSSRLSVFGRCCCLVDHRRGAAQVCPVGIGTQLFTADSAIGSALDRWAILGWNVATAEPVINNLRHYADRFR